MREGIVIKLKDIKSELSKNDQVRFRLSLGFKFAIIPTISIFFTIFINYVVLQVSVLALNSYQSDIGVLTKDILGLYFQKSLVNILPLMFVAFIVLYFLGMIMANIMIRPFRVIGYYCESKTEGKEVSYDPDFLTDLKLLSSFSEWFFNTITILKDSGTLRSVSIPEKYKKIHRPVFESSFFLHNFLIVVITCLITAILIHYGNSELYSGIEEVVKELFSKEKDMMKFLTELGLVLNLVSNFCILINIICYLLFVFYQYSLVSTPAFGIFATMRSFISGRYSARVHIIGFPYVRKYTRKLNKYLDQVERDYSQKTIE